MLHMTPRLTSLCYGHLGVWALLGSWCLQEVRSQALQAKKLCLSPSLGTLSSLDPGKPFSLPSRGDLNENGPYGLIQLTGWFPTGGIVWEGLGVALLDEVCDRALRFEQPSPFPVSSVSMPYSGCHNM